MNAGFPSRMLLRWQTVSLMAALCIFFSAAHVRAQQDTPQIPQISPQPSLQPNLQPSLQPYPQQQAPAQTPQQAPPQQDTAQGTSQNGNNLENLMEQGEAPAIISIDTALGSNVVLQPGSQPEQNRSIADIPLPISLSNGSGLIISAQTQSGWDSNALELPVDVQGNNFDGMQFLAHYEIASDRLGFQADYKPSFTFYPGLSALTSNSQSYSQRLQYRWTARTAMYWTALGAMYPSYANLVLPQSLSVGGVSIILANAATDLAQSTVNTANASTTIGVLHALGERDNVELSATGSWQQLIHQFVPPGTTPFNIRYQTLGADLKYLHALRPQQAIGFEFTELYVRGMEPRGQQTSEALLLNYQGAITQHTTFSIGAGPLFNHASAHPNVLLTGTSYAITASVAREIKLSQLYVQYQRAYQVGFIYGSMLSSIVSGGYIVPVTQHLTANLGASLVLSHALFAQQGSFNQQGYTGRLQYAFNKHNSLYFLYGRSQITSSPSSLGYNDLSRSQYSGGYTYTFFRTNQEAK
ncbi:MAG TPA: hypothetical protein VHX63_03795 [Acidobacteriaceae bacterium]|jgi:hypothetical protein|nr:hypothetical protein [Acidobacteriaceae bacterium]